MKQLLTCCFILVLISWTSAVNKTLKKEAKEYLEYLNVAECDYYHNQIVLSWAYAINATDENLNKLNDYIWNGYNVTQKDFPWADFDDPDMLRQADKYGRKYPASVYAAAAEPGSKLTEVVGKMTKEYRNLNGLCSYENKTNCSMSFGDAVGIFYETEDLKERAHYYLEILNGLARKIKPYYAQYIELSNENARIFNYSNKADQWIVGLDGPPVAEFDQYMINLYEQIKPLQQQVFAFVRKRLYDHYGPEVVNRTGPLQIHLMNDLFGSGFGNIGDLIKPYPNVKADNIDIKLKAKYKTARDLAEVCEDFFLSIGLPPMPATFWNLSQFVEPKDTQSTCQISAWNFYDRKDYRIEACSDVSFGDLLVLCHEMTHVKNYMGFKDQPCCYLNGPNAAINEGIADVIQLSLGSRERLGRMGLLEEPCEETPEIDINDLFESACDRVMFMPYAIILDLVRHKYFRNEINYDNCNEEWWKLRLEFMGLVPPEPRNGKDLFDIFIQDHTIRDITYVQYFLAIIYKIQFQEALCKAAGEYDPNDPKSKTLDKCDLYGSKKVGKLLKKMFAYGSSKPYQIPLQALTGQKDIQSKPFLKFYKRLYDWLVKENKRTGEYIGW
uniref:Angiotensin-converting enzyme n=1 Tax=Clastoptera arizonana TaxID=38151 RepID=A0A1B6DQQ8_9HEMI